MWCPEGYIPLLEYRKVYLMKAGDYFLKQMPPAWLLVPSRMITYPLGALRFSWQDRF